MNDVLVVVPTYNELGNLEAVTTRVLASNPNVDLLVVDDNSPDGTGDLADTLASKDARIHVLHRTKKSGLGDAYRAGFAWGLEQGYTAFVQMDGDGSHQPEQMPSLLAGLADADVVQGSRWITGGGAPGWAFRRRLLSLCGSTYARLALGIPLRDITGGYRVHSAFALKAIDYLTVHSQGYCFQIELLWRAQRAGLRIKEVPIEFAERLNGTSKMSGSIIAEAMWRVTVWGITGLPARIRRAFAPRAA